MVESFVEETCLLWKQGFIFCFFAALRQSQRFRYANDYYKGLTIEPTLIYFLKQQYHLFDFNNPPLLNNFVSIPLLQLSLFFIYD